LSHIHEIFKDVKYGRKIMTIADLHSISTGFKEACRVGMGNHVNMLNFFIKLRKEIRQTLALLLATGVYYFEKYIQRDLIFRWIPLKQLSFNKVDCQNILSLCGYWVHQPLWLGLNYTKCIKIELISATTDEY
jgi:hypothetical protein